MLERQPTLTADGLLLRPLLASDWDALFAVASDPLIWEQHPAHDRWKRDVFRAFFDDALAQGGALAVIDLAVTDKAVTDKAVTDKAGGGDGMIIGSSRYQGLEAQDGGSVEIGWTFLARRYWGAGTNLVMKRLMVALALSSVAECRFAVGVDNWRSRKAMERIGGRLSDRSDIRGMAGAEVRHVHYVIGRGEFDRGPLGRGHTQSPEANPPEAQSPEA